jgi:predicted DNA-binding transcriptional regulator YafY
MQILHTPENKGFLMATETLDTSKNQGTVEAPNAISLVYTNYRGETSVRRVIPQRIWFGATDWHPENQWMLDAVDVDKDAERSFALKDIRTCFG